MIFISFVIVSSILSYYVLGYGKRSVLERPSLAQITFFRDYLLLTMIPYLYYVYGDRYLSHYVLENISSSKVFAQAAVHAFVFIFLFLACFRVFESAFSTQIRKINVRINERRILFYTSILSVALFSYFVVVTIKLDASVFGLAKYNVAELEV